MWLLCFLKKNSLIHFVSMQNVLLLHKMLQQNQVKALSNYNLWEEKCYILLLINKSLHLLIPERYLQLI